MKNVILVTGASAGMGKEFAIELLKDGHIVYGAARRVDKMDDIKSLGVKVLEMDVTDEHSMFKGIETIIKNEGRIDVLINNAGSAPLSAPSLNVVARLFAIFAYTPLLDVFTRLSIAMLIHSDFTPPGSITTTLIPNCLTSLRVASLKASSANLLAWYHPPKGNATLPPIDDMLSMRP